MHFVYGQQKIVNYSVTSEIYYNLKSRRIYTKQLAQRSYMQI